MLCLMHSRKVFGHYHLSTRLLYWPDMVIILARSVFDRVCMCGIIVLQLTWLLERWFSPLSTTIFNCVNWRRLYVFRFNTCFRGCFTASFFDYSLPLNCSNFSWSPRFIYQLFFLSQEISFQTNLCFKIDITMPRRNKASLQRRKLQWGPHPSLQMWSPSPGRTINLRLATSTEIHKRVKPDLISDSQKWVLKHRGHWYVVG